MINIKLNPTFFDYIISQQMAVTIYLINGVKLQGVIDGFDDESVLLEYKGHRQLVFKHAISTVMPSMEIISYKELIEKGKE